MNPETVNIDGENISLLEVIRGYKSFLKNKKITGESSLRYYHKNRVRELKKRNDRNKTRDKVECVCGSCVKNMIIHKKSARHQNFILSQPQYNT